MKCGEGMQLPMLEENICNQRSDAGFVLIVQLS